MSYLVNIDGSQETLKVREGGVVDDTAFTQLVYIVEIFGIRRSKNNRLNHRDNNRKETRIRECRGVQRQLNKQFKMASEEKMGIAVLTDDVRSELARLKRADRIRKMKRERAKDRIRFVKKTIQIHKKLIEMERSGYLKCAKEEVEQYLKKTHSDPERNKDLGPCPRKVEVEPPESELDCEEPS